MNSAAEIKQSSVFRKWRRAFQDATHVRLHLLDGDQLEASLRNAVMATEFCRLLCGRCEQCSDCRKRFCKRLRASSINHPGPFAMRCFAGLTVTALPVLLADEKISFLFSDPVILQTISDRNPVEHVIGRIASRLDGLNERIIREHARALPIRGWREYNAAITLMHLLAEQLAHESRAMLEVPDCGGHHAYVVRRCSELIDRRFTENLHIDQVAREIGVSRSYLSHTFHRLRGLTFTDYLAGRRVIEAKRLLTHTHLPVTEILFAAGFQSISQANRVFLAATGVNPKEFRARHHLAST